MKESVYLLELIYDELFAISEYLEGRAYLASAVNSAKEKVNEIIYANTGNSRN